MSNFLLRLSAMFAMVILAGVTVCSAGDRANVAFPNPTLDVPFAAAGAEQSTVLAGGCFWGCPSPKLKTGKN